MIYVIIAGAGLWVPLHFFHFRFAQLLYLALCTLLMSSTLVLHFATIVTHIVGSRILDGGDESAENFPHHLSWWEQSSARGACGAACMLVIELSVAFSFVRLLMMFGAQRSARTRGQPIYEVLSILPYGFLSAAQTHLTTGPWLLRHLSLFDTKLDAILQRSILLPQLVSVFGRVAPSWNARLLIGELPLVARAIAIWWIKRRYMQVQKRKEDVKLRLTAENEDHDQKQPRRSRTGGSFFTTEHFLQVAGPFLLILFAHSAAFGWLLIMALQLFVDHEDWTPRRESHSRLMFAMFLHILMQLAGVVRLSVEPMKRMLGLRRSKRFGAASVKDV